MNFFSAFTSGYKEPRWSGVCTDLEYGLDILKNGVIIDNIKLTGKSYFVIGRYKTCDLVFEHPSLSRFHSVLQYCSADNDENKDRGWYIMDLDSTHGTILNKVILKTIQICIYKISEKDPITHICSLTYWPCY